MKRKKAFTIIELIFVIVVIAILATLSIPRLKRDYRYEAINNILTMMRYTHSLALHDNMHMNNIDKLKWQRAFWRFSIYNCSSSGVYFIIGSNKDLSSSIDKNESAIDPSNGKYLYSSNSCSLQSDTSPNVLLSKNFGISSVDFSSSCGSSKYIAFDLFGRYYNGAYSGSSYSNGLKVRNDDCKITFNFYNSSIKPFTIVVKKETGSVFLLNDDGTINENL